jgi:hypothetical protein
MPMMPGNAILPACYSNPYAPPWRLPNFESPWVNLRWTYDEVFLVPGGGKTQFNLTIPINGNSDFICRELAFDNGGAQPGSLLVRFKNADGRRMSHDLLQIEEYAGPIPIDWYIKKGTNVYVDIQNTDVTATLQVILKGISVYEPLGINTCMPGFEPERYLPLYKMYSRPAQGWHDEPYDMYFDVEQNVSTVIQSQPLLMDSDADFYVRGITGLAAGVGLVKVRFQDNWQNSLSAGYVLQGNEFGPAPQARPIYPEICCPLQSNLTVDLSEYTGIGNASTLFALRGVKRFRNTVND